MDMRFCILKKKVFQIKKLDQELKNGLIIHPVPELRGLQDMLHEVNPYVSYLKQGIDMMRTKSHDVRMIIRADGGPDPRRYNTPTAPEIAIVYFEAGMQKE